MNATFFLYVFKRAIATYSNEIPYENEHDMKCSRNEHTQTFVYVWVALLATYDTFVLILKSSLFLVYCRRINWVSLLMWRDD